MSGRRYLLWRRLLFDIFSPNVVGVLSFSSFSPMSTTASVTVTEHCNGCGKPGRRRCASCVNRGLGMPIKDMASTNPAALPQKRVHPEIPDDETVTLLPLAATVATGVKKQRSAVKVEVMRCFRCEITSVTLFLVGQQNDTFAKAVCRMCLPRALEELLTVH
jgi:hypothetical protein